ncbi:MAG: zinc dependent phospholipase C family protein [Eubacteriales bacterium]
MPELITHCLISDKVSAKIKDKNIKALIDTYPKEFTLGAQGGDLFFFYHYGILKNKNSVPDFGERLHKENIEDFFRLGAEYIKNHPSEPLLSYFLGYLSHYAADKNVHPFVYKKSEHSTTQHHNIEFMLGKQFLKDTTGEDAYDFDMSAPFDFDLSDDIMDFYIHLAATLYNQTLNKDQIKQAKKDFRDFKIKTQRPTAQYKLMSMIAKPMVKFDPMALTYKQENNWEYFTEVEYADFVKDVCETIKYSNVLIKSAYGYIIKDKPIDTYLKHFDGTDFNGEKH